VKMQARISVKVSYVFLDFRRACALCVCVCVCVCVRARARVCVCVCVCVRIRGVIFGSDTTSLFLSLLFRRDRSLVTHSHFLLKFSPKPFRVIVISAKSLRSKSINSSIMNRRE